MTALLELSLAEAAGLVVLLGEVAERLKALAC
jgi:hypothetical protein